MNIQTIPIFEIKRAAYNPRKTLKPGDPAYDKLKKAITAFGLVEPLVWNKRTNNLVGGHQRLSVIEEKGASHVEVSVVDLDEREEKALNLALNKHTGEWDFASLADMLQELDAGDIDMEITGFDASELEKLMTWTAPNSGLTDEDAVPEPPKVPTAKLGDVWACGTHRLLCGDAANPDGVHALLDGVKPGLMVTDPPYGVNYDPDWRNRADRANGKPDGARAIGLVTNDDTSNWREAYALFPGDVAYVWHPPGAKQVEFYESIVACGFDIRMQIIWAKSHFPIGRGNYHVQHEPCWFAVRHGKTGHWTGDRKQTTLWEIPKPVKSETGHSTQKPVECMRRPIVNHTNPGQCVYDPFLGSGTTMIAAESTGRVCYGIEIDPTYVDIAVQRWQEFTGQNAVLV